MAEIGFREKQGFGPRRDEPTIEALPTSPPAPEITGADDVIVPPPPTMRQPAFAAPLEPGADALGLKPTLGRLAELLAHRRTATPLTIGFVGADGSGKSHALGMTLDLLAGLCTAARRERATPFLGRVHVQLIDCAMLEGEAGTALAGAVYAGLREHYPELAMSAAQGAQDPHALLEGLSSKLDDTRRSLREERQALEDAQAQRARLVEIVLFETPGSGVDAYARANRQTIERRFERFGMGGDGTRRFKELVQELAESRGKAALMMRALWSLRGQAKLIVAALVCLAVAVGLGIAIDTRDAWLAKLQSGPQAGATIGTWLDAHMALLGTARLAAFVLAGVAIAANLWRAFGFTALISRGVDLLDSDLQTRRHDLEQRVAHQTKRVDGLGASADRLARDVGELEARVGQGGAASRHAAPPFATSAAYQAQNFFAALSKAVVVGDGRAPQRVVLALDHGEAVTPERWREILGALGRLGGPGLVKLVTLGPSAQGERLVDLPVRVDCGLDEEQTSRLVAGAVGQRIEAMPHDIDPHHSVFDEPLDPGEEALLRALAPLAGPTPRGIRRFALRYALARLEGEGRLGALAFLLALGEGGTAAERAAVAKSLATPGASSSSAAYALPAATPRLRAALAGAVECDGAFALADLSTAARSAARFTTSELVD